MKSLHGDCQSRPLAAAIAGFSGDSEAAEQIVEQLVVHLSKTMIIGVMHKMAVPALYRLGRSGIPHLSKYANSKDRRQLILVNLILEHRKPFLKWFESSVAFTALISGSQRPPMSPFLRPLRRPLSNGAVVEK